MDRAVVMSLVTIAKELNIKTIAEYIESEAIMKFKLSIQNFFKFYALIVLKNGVSFI
jgi:hypothetical protein